MRAAKGQYLMWASLLALAGALALLFFFAPERYPFYPRCLFHSLTGWQCPGCGGLRATHCLLHGNLSAAFHFNQLLVLLLPVFLLLGLAHAAKRMTGRDWLRRFRRPFWVWLLLAAVVIFGVGRNCQ